MLIESAFTYLPEILTGSNYEVQDYEAGITNAISLALLQELNARNVSNPLSSLVVEKLYSTLGYPHPEAGKPNRFDRADLYFDLSTMLVASRPLSRFGWRHRNYVEAKYFRPSVKNGTNNSADLLADLIRLCALVKPQVHGWERHIKWLANENKKPYRQKNPAKQTIFVPYEGEPPAEYTYSNLCVGRYLLHVYKGDPDEYLGKEEKREWAQDLIKDGRQEITLITKYKDYSFSQEESPGYIKRIAEKLSALRLYLKVTNRVIQQETPKAVDSYRCVLTRIDAFKITIGELTWEEDVNRIGKEGGKGHWKEINQMVGTYLNYVPKSDKTTKKKSAGLDEDGLEPEAPPPSQEELETIESKVSEWSDDKGMTEEESSDQSE